MNSHVSRRSLNIRAHCDQHKHTRTPQSLHPTQVGEASKFALDFNMSVDRALARIAAGEPATVRMHRMAAHEKDLIVECVQQSGLLENCVSLNFEAKDVRPCATALCCQSLGPCTGQR